MRDANLIGQLERLCQDLRHGLRVSRSSNPSTDGDCRSRRSRSAPAPTSPSSAWPTPCSSGHCRCPGRAEVVSVWGSRVRHGPNQHTPASYPDYLDLRDRASSFHGVDRVNERNYHLTLRAGERAARPHRDVRLPQFFRRAAGRAATGPHLPARRRRPARAAGAKSPCSATSLWRAEFNADPDASAARFAWADDEFHNHRCRAGILRRLGQVPGSGLPADHGAAARREGIGAA